MSFDPALARTAFPFFAAHDPPLHYLDNAATAQILGTVLEATVRHETVARANVLRGNHRLAEAATAAYDHAREQVARFLNASADEVVFTSGATAAINLLAHSFGGLLGAGDEVVVSLAEHHSNFVPWQRLAERQGVILKFLPLTAEGRIDLTKLDEVVGRRCRLVAVTHASNVTGAITDLAPIVARAREVNAKVFVDGAQMVQHGPVDVRALDVDFYAFSGHKVFAPTGIGVLWGRTELLDAMPPFCSGGGMVGEVGIAKTTYAGPPRRFEAGTPPIAQAVGLGHALNWMLTLDWPAIRDHEADLLRQLLDSLRAISSLRIVGPTALALRLPVVSFVVDGLHPHDICHVLDDRGVACRGGHHCAQPLLATLGADGGSVRASIALYNDHADIAALLHGLRDALEILR